MKIILSESSYNSLVLEDFDRGIEMKQSDIPADLVQWANSKIGNVRRWKVRQKGEVYVSGAWHENSASIYGVFHLMNDHYIKIKEVFIGGKEPFTPNEKIEIPSGFLVVLLDRMTRVADIYTSSDALKMIQDTSALDTLSDEETMALYEASRLKSPFRFKFPDEIYNSLLTKGLMAKNRSITIEGRNLINSVPRAKISEICDRLNEKYKNGRVYHRFYS